MRIQGTTPFNTQGTRKAGGSKDKSGAFSAFVDATSEEGSETTATGGTRATSAVLFAQEVDTTDENGRRNQQAKDYATGLLDQLDRIRMGLLNGGLSRDQLQNLSKIITHHQQAAADPKLNEILKDIELRVRVELAKHAAGL
jgi:hypothetical protein